MNERQQFIEQEGPVSQYQYDDGTTVLVADVGPGNEADLDVVDDTVIIVTGDDQYEFEVPAAADEPQAFIKNGVLTVEVNA